MSSQYTVPTRGDFRREYEAHLVPGEEASAFRSLSGSLDGARQRLRALRYRRVEVAKRRSEHVRKLSDWKGKVPRSLGAPIPSPKSPGNQYMPFKQIATVVKPKRFSRENECFMGLQFRLRFTRALCGLERFDKAWIIVLSNRGFVGGHEADAGDIEEVSGVCHRESTESNQKALHLVLVSIVRKCGSGANASNMVVVRAEDGDLSERLLDGVVIDIKPYLSYCEALGDNEPTAEL